MENSNYLVEKNDQIINTMVKHIGGTRFMAMTGAKPMVKDNKVPNPWVSFKLPRNGSKANHFKLIYESGMDTYSMVFFSARAMKLKETANYKGLYSDQLEEVFTRETSLCTRL